MIYFKKILWQIILYLGRAMAAGRNTEANTKKKNKRNNMAMDNVQHKQCISKQSRRNP
jgi:hypothetical protein